MCCIKTNVLDTHRRKNPVARLLQRVENRNDTGTSCQHIQLNIWHQFIVDTLDLPHTQVQSPTGNADSAEDALPEGGELGELGEAGGQDSELEGA